MKYEEVDAVENIDRAEEAIDHILKTEGYIIGAYNKEIEMGEIWEADPLTCERSMIIIDRATREDALKHLAIVQKFTGEPDMVEPPLEAFFYKMVPYQQNKPGN